MVVTANGDLSHWPSMSSSIVDTLSASFDILYPLTGIGNNLGVSIADNSLTDYENNKNWTYVNLETDTTASNNHEKELLGHTGVIDGLLAGHVYDVTVNGELKKKVTLDDIYKNYPKQVK